MANSNVSVANRLFAYIKHNVDINGTITEQYKNSLIFIGDEQQIYAPSMQAYVGIGMTAYTNTLNRINELKSDIDEATAAVKGQVVSKIWPGVSQAMATTDNNFSINEPTYMVGDITIAGLNQYDPAHPDVAKNTIDVYQYNQSTGIFEAPIAYHIPSSDALYNNGAPNSGIRIRYKQTKTTDASGNVIQSNNGIFIDDSATWAYITNTAAAIKNTTKKYVDAELNRVYRDLLGSGNSYVPVGFNSVFEAVPGENNSVQYLHTDTTDSNIYYYKQSVDSNASTYDGVLDDGTKYVWAQASFTSDGQLNTTNPCEYTNEVSTIAQLYVNNGEYNNTYNMSLTDGINTLKEVAYLLDKLSDGSLGSVTYLTYSQYNTATNNGTNTNGYYVITGANKSNATEPYAYYVNEGNPEDLGIKMAYSIAGNKADIDHVHEHVKNAEQGKTTVRSINTRYNSELGKLTIVNGHRDTTYFDIRELGNIDSVAYMGDPDVKLNLILTNTYLSINRGKYGTATYSKVDAGFGKIYYGEYLLVSPDEIDTEAALRGDISAYFVDGLTAGFQSLTSTSVPTKVEATTTDANAAPGLDTIEAIKNGQASNKSGRYFFIKTKPEYSRGDYDNVTWIKVSEDDLINRKYDDTTKYSQFFYINGEDPKRILTNGDSGTAITSSQAIMALDNYNNIKDHLYVYENAIVDTTLLKPVLDNKNAIATADWVSSYIKQEIDKVNNSQSNFQSDIENKINKRLTNLDYEYKYSDFETKFWNSYASHYSDLVEGSDVYNETYDRLYAQYKSDADISNTNSEINTQYNIVHNTTGLALKGELTNSLRNSYNSTAIVNVKQEDGKVSAEARELPTDKVNVNVDIWGEKASLKAEPLYRALQSATRQDIVNAITAAANVVDIEGAGNNLTIADILYNLNKDVELYVQSSTGSQYVAVRDGENVAGTPLYFISEQTGEYTLLTTTMVDDRDGLNAAIATGDHSHYGWKQYYKSVTSPKYVELDIPAEATNYSSGVFTFKDIEGNTYNDITENNFTSKIFYIYAYKLSDGTTIDEDSTTPVTGENLSVTLRRRASSSKYITAEVNHNDWSHGGHGENTLNLTTHITKLEDSTKENTGLADSYDVKSYIDQLFTFVDISATVTGDILVKRDAFYTLVSYEEWTDINNKASYNKPLFAKDNSGNYVSVSSPVTAYYWTNNTYCSDPAGASPSDYKTQFRRTATEVYTPSDNNYFVCNEVAKINPLNLTLTLFGTQS